MNFILRRKPIIIILLFFLINFTNDKLIAQNYIMDHVEVKKIAAKTNILYDGAMTPNIGIEVLFNEQWSIYANWYFAWWNNKEKHRYWDIYGGMLEVRKWLGKRALEHEMQGHHLGAFFSAGTYDFERGHKGYQSNFSFIVGINYGYEIRLYESLYLDFCLGIGYLGGRFKKYKPIDDKYCLIKSKFRNWFGPVNAEISLVWTFSDLFMDNKKGGAK